MWLINSGYIHGFTQRSIQVKLRVPVRTGVFVFVRLFWLCLAVCGFILDLIPTWRSPVSAGERHLAVGCFFLMGIRIFSVVCLSFEPLLEWARLLLFWEWARLWPMFIFILVHRYLN